MGTDNIHHKRKAKSHRDLNRRKAKRSSYEKILIVCEGAKTEPNYFNEIIDIYEINSANVVVDGKCGSSPKSVFEHALKKYDAEKKKGDPFDRVYCVYDKDSHPSYKETQDKIIRKKPKNIFYSVSSVPCFEYWLLLHFVYSTKPYESVNGLSAGEQVFNELTAHMPDYSKGKKDTFSILLDQFDTAKSNAIRANRTASQSDTDNPSTQIHELISFLQDINNNV